MTDLEGYAISADGAELKWQDVDAKGEKPKPEKDARWGEFQPGTRLWKKSSIPFAQGQTREILIRYRSPYAAIQSSVSDDGHSGEAYFRYSLSPAATWKGPIGKGKVTLNYLHPRPEEISIKKPKDRFKKINDTAVRLGVPEPETDPGGRHQNRGPSGSRNLSRARRIRGELRERRSSGPNTSSRPTAISSSTAITTRWRARPCHRTARTNTTSRTSRAWRDRPPGRRRGRRRHWRKHHADGAPAAAARCHHDRARLQIIR